MLDSTEITLDVEFAQDPHTFYTRVRSTGPVRQVRLGTGLRVWLVTDYAEARALLANTTLSKDIVNAKELLQKHYPPGGDRVDFGVLSEHMLNSDPPKHTRLRKLVNKAFTAGGIDHLRPRIAEIAADLLAGLAGADEIDLLADFAFPLPITVISEVLGIPAADRTDFREWSTTLLSNSHPSALKETATALGGYLAALIEAKRADPGEDLLTHLIHATEDGDRLTDGELSAMTFLLLVAGHETTVNLIGNAVLGLLTHPAQSAALRADPSLLPGAVEEFLRFDGPVGVSTMRYTTEPITVGDTEIPAGEFVVAALTAANRDPARFPDPDTLDITRPAGGHLGFGHGIHYCVGAPLARMEAEIAIGALFEHFPDLALVSAPTDLRWRDSTLIHAMETLWVKPGAPGFHPPRRAR